MQTAIRLISKAIERAPHDPQMACDLGLSYQALGDWGHAIPAFQKAIALAPLSSSYHRNLADCFVMAEQLNAALIAYGRALALGPGDEDTWLNLGVALMKSKLHHSAMRAFLCAKALNPQSNPASENLESAISALVTKASDYQRSGNLPEADKIYRKLLAIDPHQVIVLHLAGILAYDQKDFARAYDLMGLAVGLCQTNMQIFYDFGQCHMRLGHWPGAVTAFTQTLILEPDFARAWSNLGSALYRMTHVRPVEKLFRRALRVDPSFVTAAANLVFIAGRSNKLSGPEFRAIAEEYEKSLPEAIHQAAHSRQFKTPNTPIRIGYVSGDFYANAVAIFMAPIFEAHDRDRFDVYLYPTRAFQDPVTQRLQRAADHWRPLYELDDDDAAVQKILGDGIDVLIDLSGHVSGNALGLFARRAAPIQCHYIGFFGSTGLSAMDYWIGDQVLTPPDTDHHFTETVYRLNRCFMAYQPDPDAPLPIPQPNPGSGIRFGCFNAAAKISDLTIALWSRLLRAEPDATLLLKASEFNVSEVREKFARAFAEQGIDQRRLILRNPDETLDWVDHMALYGAMDVALDPVDAQGGVTTTCEALWMGVPVIALAGDRMAARMSTSLLAGLGRADWMAHNPDDYIHKAIAAGRRRWDRQALRAQMAASELCDTAGLTRALEAAYMNMLNQRAFLTC
jgi:predicted O-linked N-acetylglucosamine transferase (SPINDLY family)